LAIVVALLAVTANAQSNKDCRAFSVPGRFPPDHGDFGSCGVTIPHLGSCTYSCDSDQFNTWSVVGTPFSCDNQELSRGPMSCAFNNYVHGKRNCTVSSWNQRAETECNTMCGGGSQTWTRTVESYGEPGGEPCPRLAITVPCNTGWCQDIILDKGYYSWGPFCAGSAPRTVGYVVNTNQDIDLYIFDQSNFMRYTWDAALPTPQNTYYQPVNAYLTTNFESDVFTIPANQCYYLVLDNSDVGPTKGNNGDYSQPVYFNYAIKGANIADGFSDFGYQKGSYQPAAAVRSSSVSFFGAFLTAIIVLILKLE